MSAKATRSERILDRIGARLGLSDAGKQWLIAALDPFHDNPLDCIGYPDGSTSPCVTRVQKYTQTLTAPPGLSTSANWDLMILDTPHPQLVKLFLAQMAGTSTGQPLNIIVLNNAVSNPFGGLWCVTAPAGSNFDFSSVELGLAAGTYGLFPLTIDPTITSGDFRIIAKGFEVHNVTAELYKGGTVTVFQTPLDSYDTAQAFMVTNSGGGGSTTSVLVNPQWPQNSTVAFSLVNSKQWEARDGCYVPGRQLETEIPVENGLNFTDPFYYEGQATITPILGTSQAAYADLAGTQDGIPATLWENFNLTGAFFTGLTYQSALTVNYLVIVENHPSSQDNIYSLAKPPPCRDDIALSMYSCIVREMPIGVPVAQNGLGDWFADAVSTVSDYISPVLSAIPHPGTMALGAGLRAAGNVAKAYNTNPNANPNVGMSVPSGGGAASKAATKLRNAEIRARNEEIRLRAAAKAAKKK